jgi:hypothetical protein
MENDCRNLAKSYESVFDTEDKLNRRDNAVLAPYLYVPHKYSNEGGFWGFNS